ncbi:SEC-C motif domain protein [Candidatus Magnetobacterium bavaricum]|uniref:SEC-C motif domain protein n=1 Tax=Candidatus Magnetobacterium bavaricum TaxID=29290 RepID=A0A0F3GS79_9BACT|nr:SEC-C motif domain protein [Candidatus Magnetobacterium bavaricum]
MKTVKFDLCPCGSGKTYKNCCYKPTDDNKIVKLRPQIKSSVDLIKLFGSIFAPIENPKRVKKEIPKGEQCSCGSGRKYSRCCYKMRDTNKIVKLSSKMQPSNDTEKPHENIITTTEKPKNNKIKVTKVEQCTCGSGKKYRDCCYKPQEDNNIVKLQPKVKTHSGPKKVLESMLKKMEGSKSNSWIISIDKDRLINEVASDINSLYTEDKDEHERVSAIYNQIQNRFYYFCEEVIGFSEFNDWYEKVVKFDDEYTPNYPPISPVTSIHFNSWTYVDLRFEKEQVTIGEVYQEVFTNYGGCKEGLELIDNFNKSSMRIYEIIHRDSVHNFVWVKDIITKEEYKAYCANGYTGNKIGELWLVRLLPPPLNLVDYGVIFTTPYVLINRTKDEWITSLKMEISKTKIEDTKEAYKHLMKHGLNNRYWNEFIVNSYFSHQENAIFLGCLLQERLH